MNFLFRKKKMIQNELLMDGKSHAPERQIKQTEFRHLSKFHIYRARLTEIHTQTQTIRLSEFSN